MQSCLTINIRTKMLTVSIEIGDKISGDADGSKKKMFIPGSKNRSSKSGRFKTRCYQSHNK